MRLMILLFVLLYYDKETLFDICNQFRELIDQLQC